MINQTLTTGEFPNELKISKVKPLFKTGDTLQINNYRPISLLPSVSKIYEYIILDQLLDYMETNQLLSLQQFGFRRGYSTELAALRLTDHLTKEMDNFRMPVNVFLDLSKAFDTLDHEILLSKLKFYCVCDSGNNLFRSYLSNRFQFVDLNGSKSTLKKYIQVCPKVLFWVLYCF